MQCNWLRKSILKNGGRSEVSGMYVLFKMSVFSVVGSYENYYLNINDGNIY